VIQWALGIPAEDDETADPGGFDALGGAHSREFGRALAAPGQLSAEQLCNHYADRVYRFANMVARDDLEADDLAQTALVHALKALPSFDPGRGEVTAWLWRIVVNAARDHQRAAKRRELLLLRLRGLWGASARVGDVLEPPGITDERLFRAVRRLSPLQRSVVALRFGGDLEWGGVAAALGISRSAAASAGHRALLTLRAALVEEEHPIDHERREGVEAPDPEER
jgi:DNA-directed RNA polymerase specialized sigma24 family protein